MKLSLDLKDESSQEWIDCVMNNFDTFLQDHADCERKASAMSMSFVAKYPDRFEIIPELIETAIEELEHFQSVYALMKKRNIPLPLKMSQDLYMKKLIALCHSGREERFLDKMLVASVAECRGAERFKKVADNLENIELSRFYKDLWISEAKHGNIYVKMALIYFDRKKVFDRLNWWVERESDIFKELEIRPALH